MNSKWTSLQAGISAQNCLTSENPVIMALKSGNLQPNQGIEVLRQYFYLVATITQFLSVAMVRIPWATARKELRQNLNEELGSRSFDISHQEILEYLLKKELDVDVRTVWNDSTKNFISNLLLLFHTCSTPVVAGMVYALEATACPELLVVGEILNLSAQKQVVDLAKLKDSDQKLGDVKTLHDFLAMHTLVFEVGHESRLRITLGAFAEKNWPEFEDGFYQVLSLIQIWWKGLTQA